MNYSKLCEEAVLCNNDDLPWPTFLNSLKNEVRDHYEPYDDRQLLHICKSEFFIILDRVGIRMAHKITSALFATLDELINGRKANKYYDEMDEIRLMKEF